MKRRLIALKDSTPVMLAVGIMLVAGGVQTVNAACPSKIVYGDKNGNITQVCNLIDEKDGHCNYHCVSSDPQTSPNTDEAL